MLILQQFKVNGHQISLKNIGTTGIIAVMEEETGTEQRFELELPLMRKLVRILNDSPFIFSERNNEK